MGNTLMTDEQRPDVALPGSGLHAWMARVVSPETLRRIVSPVLADYQKEMLAAVSSGPVARAMLRVQWTGSLVAALALDLVSRPASEVERAQHRRLWSGLALACGVVTALVVLPIFEGGGPLSGVPHVGRPALALELMLCLLPSALAVGLPAGVLLGGLACAPAPTGRRRPLALAGAGGAIVVLLLLAFVVPSSNQAYRLAYRQAVSPPDERSTPAKGPREMTFGELRETGEKQRAVDVPGHGRLYDAERHRRLALAASCIVLVWFAAGLAGSRVARTLPRRLAVTIAVSTVYLGLFGLGTRLVTGLTVDSPAPVWLANGVFLVLAGAMHVAWLRRLPQVPAVI
jgi:hypothetical protein